MGVFRVYFRVVVYEVKKKLARYCIKCYNTK